MMFENPHLLLIETELWLISSSIHVPVVRKYWAHAPKKCLIMKPTISLRRKFVFLKTRKGKRVSHLLDLIICTAIGTASGDQQEIYFLFITFIYNILSHLIKFFITGSTITPLSSWYLRPFLDPCKRYPIIQQSSFSRYMTFSAMLVYLHFRLPVGRSVAD